MHVWKTFCAAVLVTATSAGSAHAAEYVPPGQPIAATTEPRWVLTRAEIEVFVVDSEALDRCRVDLRECQKTIVERTEPKPGFWETKNGLKLKYGGFTVAISGAFLAGFYAAKEIEK